ncbi:uncharacterized protein V6R79_019177 [Siganus canaliculatus]
MMAATGDGRGKPLAAVEVEEKLYSRPERSHVETLLDLSEEETMKDLELHDYHFFSGWEEDIQGWTRAAPYSCLLLAPKRWSKSRHKDMDNLLSSSHDPTHRGADSSAYIAGHHCESHIDLPDSFKKSMTFDQHTGFWSKNTVTDLQRDASKWPQNITSKSLLSLKEEEDIPREASIQIRPSRKHIQKSNNTVVPIKNFTFFPPIHSLHVNCQGFIGQETQERESMEGNCYMSEKKSQTRGTRSESIVNPVLSTHSAVLISKYRTYLHNPQLSSGVGASSPRRYQVSVSSKHDTVHCSSYSVSKRLTQTLHPGAAVGAQAQMHPSRTACALTL